MELGESTEGTSSEGAGAGHEERWLDAARVLLKLDPVLHERMLLVVEIAATELLSRRG